MILIKFENTSARRLEETFHVNSGYVFWSGHGSCVYKQQKYNTIQNCVKQAKLWSANEVYGLTVLKLSQSLFYYQLKIIISCGYLARNNESCSDNSAAKLFSA